MTNSSLPRPTLEEDTDTPSVRSDTGEPSSRLLAYIVHESVFLQ